MRPTVLPRLTEIVASFYFPSVQQRSGDCRPKPSLPEPRLGEAKMRCREAASKKGPFPSATSLGLHLIAHFAVACSQ